jgi:ferredoxin-NADP reductase
VAPFLVRKLAAGRRVTLAGPHGRYCLPESPPEGVEGFLHLCAGSGVAPNRGMIRHALRKGWPQRHLLLLQDRGPEHVLFRDEWRELAARHSDRFRIRHLFSRSGGEYLSEDAICLAMEGYFDAGRALAFVCGPNAPRAGQPGFVDRWRGNPKTGAPGLLTSLGFPADRILTER